MTGYYDGPVGGLDVPYIFTSASTLTLDTQVPDLLSPPAVAPRGLEYGSQSQRGQFDFGFH